MSAPHDGCGHAHGLREELRAHLPYTVAFALLGAVAALWLAGAQAVQFGERQFHASHFLHVASATAAMMALVSQRGRTGIGAVLAIPASAVVLCAVADTAVPWIGMTLLGHAPHMHLCALEHPGVVVSCAAAGTAAGAFLPRAWRTCSHWLHSVHILVANVAAVLFILSNAPQVGPADALGIAATLTAAIGLTCICGDVVIPSLLSRVAPAGETSRARV